MTIDEVGDHRVRNKKDGIKTEKKTKSSDWQAFREEVQKYVPLATELMSNWRHGIEEKY